MRPTQIRDFRVKKIFLAVCTAVFMLFATSQSVKTQTSDNVFLSFASISGYDNSFHLVDTSIGYIMEDVSEEEFYFYINVQQTTGTKRDFLINLSSENIEMTWRGENPEDYVGYHEDYPGYDDRRIGRVLFVELTMADESKKNYRLSTVNSILFYTEGKNAAFNIVTKSGTETYSFNQIINLRIYPKVQDTDVVLSFLNISADDARPRCFRLTDTHIAFRIWEVEEDRTYYFLNVQQTEGTIREFEHEIINWGNLELTWEGKGADNLNGTNKAAVVELTMMDDSKKTYRLSSIGFIWFLLDEIGVPTIFISPHTNYPIAQVKGLRIYPSDNASSSVNTISVADFDIYTVADELRINARTSIGQVAVINLSGVVVKTKYSSDNKVAVNISDLPSGIYLVRTSFGTKKFVKK